MNKTQLSVIIGGVGLVVLLLFGNTKLPQKEEAVVETESVQEVENVFVAIIADAKKHLAPEKGTGIEKLENALAESGLESSYTDVISFWDDERQAVVAAYYAEQKANAFSTAENWNVAANRYYKAIRFVEETQRSDLYSKAITCYDKTLAIEPGNVAAKIDLAACYVAGSPQPMKGIGLLREVEKVDSNNVKLQLTFAEFSLQSGQLDKAILRYEKALAIQPDLIDTYLHLADVYRMKGDNELTISNLEKYVALTDNLEAKREVQGYIEKLKN